MSLPTRETWLVGFERGFLAGALSVALVGIAFAHFDRDLPDPSWDRVQEHEKATYLVPKKQALRVWIYQIPDAGDCKYKSSEEQGFLAQENQFFERSRLAQCDSWNFLHSHQKDS